MARLNASVRSSPTLRAATDRSATWLAWVEVLLMGGLAVGGQRGSAVRMLASVALVYMASEALGAVWPRRRPFVRLSTVEALVPHAAGRSFPSRHVASGIAMAIIGRRAHPRLGMLMAGVAWALGASRVAAGLHYPSDIVGGAVLGLVVGQLVRARQRSIG